jgi:putative ABC transport system permease protein
MHIWRGIPPSRSDASVTQFLFWRENNRIFESMTAVEVVGAGVNLTGGDEPEVVRGARVSAEFFRVYGIPPAQGRSFTAEEDRPGGDRVVVISDGLWKRR